MVPARIGARKLFYGPINQVLPPATTALDRAAAQSSQAHDAVAAIARRDRRFHARLAPHTRPGAQGVPGSPISRPNSTGDLAAMGKIFGEELPSGLVFHE
jgi:hypothetical protein